MQRRRVHVRRRLRYHVPFGDCLSLDPALTALIAALTLDASLHTRAARISSSTAAAAAAAASPSLPGNDDAHLDI